MSMSRFESALHGHGKQGVAKLFRNLGLIVAKTGTGTPEAAVVGSVGDLYVNLSGGAATTLYVKTSGNNTNTGWSAK